MVCRPGLDLRAAARSGEDGGGAVRLLDRDPGRGRAPWSLAYRPIRREPFTVLSFTWAGSPASWPSRTSSGRWWPRRSSSGSARSTTGPAGWAWPSPSSDWIGLIGLGIAGRRAAGRHRRRARRGAQPGLPRARPSRPRRPGAGGGGSPAPSRSSRGPCEVTRNIDYWGDGLKRHRLDVYQLPPGPARGRRRSWCTSTAAPG